MVHACDNAFLPTTDVRIPIVYTRVKGTAEDEALSCSAQLAHSEAASHKRGCLNYPRKMTNQHLDKIANDDLDSLTFLASGIFLESVAKSAFISRGRIIKESYSGRYQYEKGQ